MKKSIKSLKLSTKNIVPLNEEQMNEVKGGRRTRRTRRRIRG